MTERDVLKGIAYRLRKGHRDIATRAGVSQPAITRMLNGGTALRTDKLAQICEALGVELIMRKGKKEYIIHNINGEVVADVRKVHNGIDETSIGE